VSSEGLRYLLVAARKDLRRRLADPTALAIWMGVPVLIGLLMLMISGGARGPAVPKARLLIADLDQSTLSKLLTGAATGGQLGEFLEAERVTEAEGRRRLDAGEATALLVIPKGFADAVVNETPSGLRLVTNPAQRILPSILEEGLDIALEGVFYLQRLFGEPLRRIAAGPAEGGRTASDAEVAAIATAINQRLRALDGVLLPPAITLETATDGPQPAAPQPNLGMLFVPGMLLMSIVFIAQGMSGDLWQEKRAGTLQRTLALPRELALFLAGKILASAVLGAIVSAVGLAVVAAAFEASLPRLPGAWLWCVLVSAALVTYFSLVQVLATSERGGELLSTMIVFPLIMLGGSFFPFEAMPAWMAAVGRFTPNGLAVVRLKEILAGTASLDALAASSLAILLPAVAAGWLCLVRLRGRFATE
jgi:ABC-type Na+ efflux pump permease subunit